MFAEAAFVDDTSRLWQAHHPDDMPEHRRLAYDQTNLLVAAITALHQVAGGQEQFRPMYAPAGTVWADDDPVELLPGGYVEMTQAETLDWLASLPAWQGRITTTAQ